MKHHSLSLIVFIVLSGCYSFNSVQLPGNMLPNQTSQSVQIHWEDPLVKYRDELNQKKIIVSPENKNKSMVCPPFVLPPIPLTPALPYAALKKIAPTDTKALDLLERQHIEDLRLYIISVRTIIKTAYSTYLASCPVPEADPSWYTSVLGTQK